MVWPEPRPQDVVDAAAAGFRPLAGEPSPFGEHPRGSAYNAELPLDRFGSERELADRVLERLAPWFEIRREVTGRHCSGRLLRVDAMLRPRDAGSWRDPKVAFGVEFKLPGDDSGIGTYAGWVAQAVSYTHTDWDGYGRRVVLVCPGAASWLAAKSDMTCAPVRQGGTSSTATDGAIRRRARPPAISQGRNRGAR